GRMKKADRKRSVPLLELAHARSGDKGDTANVGLIALKPEYYPILVKHVTAARVARHFKGMISGPVERYELPNLHALNFLLHGALDGGVRVVALRGAGSDFCAGMDLNELLASADKSVEENRQAALRFAEIFVRMRRIPKPIVAVVQGRALAGGCGLATACDLVLATESAKFGYPEVQRGFVPAIVMTLLKRTAGEKVAFDLAATGRILGASEAAGLGLVSRVYEDSDF